MGLRIIEQDENGVEHRVLTQEQLAKAYDTIRNTPASNAGTNYETSGLVSKGDYGVKVSETSEIASKLTSDMQQQLYDNATKDLADHPRLLDLAQGAQALVVHGTAPSDRLLKTFDEEAQTYIKHTMSPYVVENRHPVAEVER